MTEANAATSKRTATDRTWSRRRERERVHGRTMHLLTIDGMVACGRNRRDPAIHAVWRLEHVTGSRQHRCLTCDRLAPRLELEGRLVAPPPTPEQVAAERVAAREESHRIRHARWLASQRVAA